MGNPIFTNLDNYYEGDGSNWGDYQYIFLSEIVNNFMMDQDPDSIVANVDRSRVVFHAKKCVQDLYYDAANEVIALEFDLNPTLTIALPHDYIQYVRISWVDQNGKLRPMAVDNSNNLAQAYLQDNNYDFLYDAEGGILEGSHIQNTQPSANLSDGIQDLTLNARYGAKPFNTDRSKIYKNGSYRINKEQGVIQFSSEATGRTIVLEYISDGLYQRQDSEIKIHKFAENAVYDYIYWKLIRMRRSVNGNEKETARREWFNSKRIAKRRINPIRIEDIRQVMKGGSKWIKD